MQYVFKDRRAYVTTVEFRNTSPILNIEKIRSFRETGVTGSFIKKEVRWSFDNSNWTPWQTLNTAVLTSISFLDNKEFYLHVRYTRSSVISGNINTFVLTYDSLTSTAPSGIIDADLLNGFPGIHYLNSENHFGPIGNLIVDNTIDGSSIGVYDYRVDTSLQTELYFKSLFSDYGLILTEDTSGLIKINLDPQVIADLSIGFLNVGDGSAGVFAEIDSSKNVRLRTFVGAQGIQVAEDGEKIVIRTDTSYGGGEINLAENIVGGEASIYSTKRDSDGALLFKSLSSSENTLLIYSDTSTVFIDVISNLYLKEASINTAGGKLVWVDGKLDVSILADVNLEYVDGSLAIRDASIDELRIKDASQDVSINHLYNWSISQDGSIIRIDSSIQNIYTDLSTFNAWQQIQDISIMNLFAEDASIRIDFDASLNELRLYVDGSLADLKSSISSLYDWVNDLWNFVNDFNGENIGTGTGLLFKQKFDNKFEIRTIEGGPNVLVQTVGDVVRIDMSGDLESVNGGVWITDINPTSTGNVGGKVYSSDGEVLDSCITDTANITVSVLAIPGHTNYKPVITIDGTPVTMTADPDKPLFLGSLDMTLSTLDTSIMVRHEDGAYHKTVIGEDEQPVILDAYFTGGYPGEQSELKAGDTYDLYIETDVSINLVEIDNYGAYVYSTYFISDSSLSRIIEDVVIANRGTQPNIFGFKVRVRKSSGSYSEWYYSEFDQIDLSDGVGLVKLNNRYPTITYGNIVYPGVQKAIKSGDSATVENTVLYYTTLSYTSPNGELTIINASTYETSKIVTWLSGSYNILENNLSITANRAENNATTGPISTVVWIANLPATLTIVNPAERLRSGGNDGTSAQNHTIQINSNQRLLVAPTLNSSSGGGTWQGSSFSWTLTSTSFTRQLQVHDDMLKGVYAWGPISGTNLAGIVTTTTNGGNTTYTLGGFVSRDVSLGAFDTSTAINVQVMDYDKFTTDLNWVKDPTKILNARQDIGTTAPPPVPFGWSIDASGINPTIINILDTEAAASSSQPSTLVGIEETI